MAAVSILVCTRDRREMLELLLADLRVQQYDGEIEIVVVEETDAPRPPDGVVYVSHPLRNRGIAFARNLAIEHASHELLVFVDDDCRVGSGWLAALVAPFADTSVLGVQGGVTVPGESSAVGWAESLLGFPGGGVARVQAAGGQVTETREVSTLNAAYRRRAVLQAGSFTDVARFGGEDYLLAKRIAEQGRLLFVPQALVYHQARGRVPAIWRWFVRRGRAEMDLIRAGVAPRGYGRHILCASFSLKLVIALASVPWLGWWLPALLIGMVMAMNWWRLRWAVGDPEVPAAAYMVAPLVRLTMDFASDAGRLRQILALQAAGSE